MEILLTTMTKPTMNLIQKQERDKKIRRIGIPTLEAHSDILEIEDKYKGDIDATNINNLWTSIASIRHRTPTISADQTPWKQYHIAGMKNHAQNKPTGKSDYLRSVLRLRSRIPSPGVHHITTKKKTYRTTPRCGPKVPKLATHALKRDGSWTTTLETTSSYQARKLQTLARTQQHDTIHVPLEECTNTNYKEDHV